MTDFHIYLASASPRRRELLTQIGVRFELIALDLDEAPLPDEQPEAYVKRVALDKARAGINALGPEMSKRPVLGADTAVVLDSEILGKPRDYAHALEMLAALSGRSHEVLSAVALADGEKEQVSVQRSRVAMRPISNTEIEAYWASGEPQGKAGAYAIQGHAAIFIAHLDGSFSGVMGLPLYETAELLKDFGINLLATPLKS